MRRGPAAVALLAALLPATPAVAMNEPHDHPAALFRVQYETYEPSVSRIYGVFLTDPADPGSFLVERRNWAHPQGPLVDLRPSDCPALGPAVRRLGSLPVPAVALTSNRVYDHRRPLPASYRFDGFISFPNGGQGQVSFYGWDQPEQPADPLLDAMRALVRAFDACRPPAR